MSRIEHHTKCHPKSNTHEGDSPEKDQFSTATPNQFETESQRRYIYRDYSRSVNELTSVLPRTTSKRTKFPVLLHRILSNPDYSDIITWLPHGRSWKVLKPKAFEASIIPRYFDHASYPSFCRQVNGWGFIRVTSGPDQNSYYHEFFLRGIPQLAEKMTRPAGFRKPSTGANVCPPNFEQISKESPLPESTHTKQTSNFSENTDAQQIESQVVEAFNAANDRPNSLGSNRNGSQSHTDNSTLLSSASLTNEYQRLLHNMASPVNYSQVNNSYDSATLAALLNMQENTSLTRLPRSPPQQLGAAAFRCSAPLACNLGIERNNIRNNILEVIGQNNLFSQNQNSLNLGTTGNLLNSRTVTTLSSLLNNAPTGLTQNANLTEASPTNIDVNKFQHDLRIREMLNMVASGAGAGAGNTTNSTVGSSSSLDTNVLTELRHNNNSTEVPLPGANETGLQIQDRRMREILQMVDTGAVSTGGVNAIASLDTFSNSSNSMLPELPVSAHSSETASGIDINNFQMQDPRIREILWALQANRYS